MKLSRYIVPAVLIVLIASFVSCSRVRTEEVRNTITAADSLLTTAPHAALDTLLSIDSVTVAKLSGNLRADYALLLAEAEYKCYEPLADNEEDIIYAVNRFRKHGPEEDYARTLMMQGAMLYEKGDAEAALQSYKAAEPFWEKLGDLEQLGLLHTRIGELYLRSAVNSTQAAERFSKALDCFEKAGLTQRVMYTHLSLATSLASNSPDSAMEHITLVLDDAGRHTDRIFMLNAYQTYLALLLKSGDYDKVSDEIGNMFTEYGDMPQNGSESEIYNTVYSISSAAFLARGNASAAMETIKRISPQTDLDSMANFRVLSEMAKSVQDWESAYRYGMDFSSIRNQILKNDYEQHLVEAERKYDNSILKGQLLKKERNIILLLFLCLILVSLLVIRHFRIKYYKEKREAEYSGAINEINELRITLLSSQTEGEEKDRTISALQKEIEHHHFVHKQDEELNRILQKNLSHQSSANIELMSLNGDLLQMSKALSEICHIYGQSSRVSDKVLEALQLSLHNENTFSRVDMMLEHTFPGFISGLFKEYSWLNADERKIITLMCCGFTPNTVAVIIGTDASSLNSKKTRMAKKMNIKGRLSTYLKRRMLEYNASYI